MLLAGRKGHVSPLTNVKKGKRIGQVLLVMLGLLVIWGSWEEPNLHNYARPVTMMQRQGEGFQNPAQSATAQQQIAAMPGVAACVINTHTQVATVLYREADVSEQEIERVLSVGGTFKLVRPIMVAPKPTGRECPVPASYLETLERIRFAFNLRRLFITV
jgi:beta-phosphoglucomutase-like phosphatase (HAD superfamily)